MQSEPSSDLSDLSRDFRSADILGVPQTIKGFDKPDFYEVFLIDGLVKSHEFNYRWLSKKVRIQGVRFFQKRGHTCSMPNI